MSGPILSQGVTTAGSVPVGMQEEKSRTHHLMPPLVSNDLRRRRKRRRCVRVKAQ